MSNPYKKMIVLSEEYLRLKQKITADAVPAAAAVVQPETVVLPTLPHFVCKICGKIYKQKQDLRRHVKFVHRIAPPKQVIIPIIQEKKEVVAPTPINKKKKPKRLAVFDKVRKWMTIHD